jgi:hypothetical protein
MNPLTTLLLKFTLRYLISGMHYLIFTGPVLQLSGDSLALGPVDSLVIMQHSLGCEPVKIVNRQRLKQSLRFRPDTVSWCHASRFHGYAPTSTGQPTRYKASFFPWQHPEVCRAINKPGCNYCDMRQPFATPRHDKEAVYYYEPIKLYQFTPDAFEAPDEEE